MVTDGLVRVERVGRAGRRSFGRRSRKPLAPLSSFRPVSPDSEPGSALQRLRASIDRATLHPPGYLDNARSHVRTFISLARSLSLSQRRPEGAPGKLG